jgi:RNA polymerase sigma factor for flagellar operon FliA
MDVVVPYVHERKQFGTPIGEFQLMQGKLADTIRGLSEQEKMVLSLYYNEELNLKEIGQVLGVVESRVSQIRTKAILKLRAKLRGVILNEGKG